MLWQKLRLRCCTKGCAETMNYRARVFLFRTQRAMLEDYAQRNGFSRFKRFTDEGLTGARMEQRDDFNRMLADCRKGKIDRVLVKSISRFSWNARDCLATLRELTALGVAVCFEKENIDTGTLTTEPMVSVSGALAQEESVSISKNQRLSCQRRMEGGAYHLLRTAGLSAGGRQKSENCARGGQNSPLDFSTVFEWTKFGGNCF